MAATILMASVVANAQNEVGQISIAPTVGLNIANTNADGAKSLIGFVAGATAEYGVTEKFGVTGALQYSMQGDKEFGEKVKMNYLNIPILANWYVWKSLAVKAGIQPGFLLSAKAGSYDIKDECESFDLTIPMGLSYELNNIVIDARYNLGLTKIVDVDGGAKHSVFQFTVGYKFKL